MDGIIRHLFATIPALDALRGWERFKAEEAVYNALCDAIDEHLDADIEHPDLDNDPDPDPGEIVVPFRRVA